MRKPSSLRAPKSVRTRYAKPKVEQLESRDMLNGMHLFASMVPFHKAPAAPSSPGIAWIGSVYPSDTFYGYGWQWDMNESQLPQAWSLTTGTYHTTVAVIDTGIDYNHLDLYQNIWINQAEIPYSRLRNLTDVDHDGLITFADLNNPINQGLGKIMDQNGDGVITAADILAPVVKTSWGADTGYGGWADGISEDGDYQHVDDLVGWNFVNNTNNPYDDNGHGTHVSGTIGAMGDNGYGVAGIDWHVQLMALKFLNGSGYGGLDAAADAVNYSVRHGAQISNNSWGASGFYLPLAQAIGNAQAAGDIFVAAAGNSSQSLWLNGFFPADLTWDNMVRVGATDYYHNLAYFSNYGYGLEQLAAPGVYILSTLPGNTYGWYSGTSMAAPHVTGVLALLHDLHPDWSYHRLIDAVVNTATPFNTLVYKTTSMGEVNALRALNYTYY